MRSSKKRSRSNQNRPRTLGNIINRVFDSSGPEGKVRGTPQQIIEKYQMLARDAQLSNDRVAAENFLQHAEHYTRMLAEAQREMAAEQEARQAQYGQNGNQNGGNQNGGNQNGGNQNGGRDYRDREGYQPRDRDGYRDRTEEPRAFRDPGAEEQPMMAGLVDLDPGADTLVETPESRRREDTPRAERFDRRDRRDRRDREDRAPASAPPSVPEPVAAPAPVAAPVAAAAAAEPAPAERPKKPRPPRKPKAEGPVEAAE